MKKNKLLMQTVVCLIMMTVFTYCGKSGNPKIASCREEAADIMMHQMTAEEAMNYGAALSSKLFAVPEKMAAAITEANSRTLYCEPIDERSSEAVKQVHAAAGGMVVASGRDKVRGLYIEIRHDNAVSVYGQLCDIGVVESERVQRGEIIGSYDTNCGKDFFYELRKDVV